MDMIQMDINGHDSDGHDSAAHGEGFTYVPTALSNLLIICWFGMALPAS